MTTTKKRRVAKRPAYEAALKWVRWYVADAPQAKAHRSRWLAQPKLEEAAAKAGHRWAQVREALIATGAAEMEYRGRGGTWWRFPEAKATTEVKDTPTSTPDAHLPASTTVKATVHAPSPVSSGGDAELAVEWARLEGMAIAADVLLGDRGILVEQVAKVRALAEVIPHG